MAPMNVAVRSAISFSLPADSVNTSDCARVEEPPASQPGINFHSGDSVVPNSSKRGEPPTISCAPFSTMASGRRVRC